MGRGKGLLHEYEIGTHGIGTLNIIQLEVYKLLSLLHLNNELDNISVFSEFNRRDLVSGF